MDLKSIPQLYQIAFRHGRSWRFEEDTIYFSVSRAGVLRLPSGRIVACDPLVSGSREPFVQGVPPGRYPVDLALARRDEEKEERIVLARVLFTKNAPVMWVRALGAKKPQETAENAEGAGYVVTTGTGAFMDAEAASLFHLDTIDDVDRILDDLMANYRPVRNWLEHAIDERHNVILFTSGFETEIYPSYFAVDAGGDICLLVTVCWRDLR